MLDATDNLFRLRLEVIEGGVGFFLGILDEPDQSPKPPYIFTANRRALRVDPNSPIAPGMVIRTPGGMVFMVAENGPSEQTGGVFKSFRLFEATHRMTWSRRIEVMDPIVGVTKDAGLEDKGLIWCAFEPDQKETLDRALRANFETSRVTTTSLVERDDLIGEFKVTRADQLIGLRICSVG